MRPTANTRKPGMALPAGHNGSDTDAAMGLDYLAPRLHRNGGKREPMVRARNATARAKDIGDLLDFTVMGIGKAARRPRCP